MIIKITELLNIRIILDMIFVISDSLYAIILVLVLMRNLKYLFVNKSFEIEFRVRYELMIIVDSRNNNYSFITLAQKCIFFFLTFQTQCFANFSSHLKKLHCSWFLVSSAAVLYLLESKQQNILFNLCSPTVFYYFLITYYKVHYKFILHILTQSHL